MKIAFISDANTPGPLRHVTHPDDWQINGVEALAWALHAQVWHGTELTLAAVNHLATFDAVIINLKHTLWPIVPDLHRALAGRAPLIGYQEGPSDHALQLDPQSLDRYLTAYRTVDRLLVYDTRAQDWFAHLRGDTQRRSTTHYLPLPVPVDIYPEYEIPWDDRPDDPPRICLCQPVSAGRGAALALHLAASTGARVLLQGVDAAEIATVSRLIATAGGIPDMTTWTPWVPPRPDYPTSFLQRLAQCRLALNLDTAQTYGRFCVDCAGLGVPCIGLSHNFMQTTFWPGLTIPHWYETSRLQNKINLLKTPDVLHSTCNHAARTLKPYAPQEIRAAFYQILHREPRI